MFWIVLLLILGGVALFPIVLFEAILKRDVERLQDRVKMLENRPTDDPFKDL